MNDATRPHRCPGPVAAPYMSRRAMLRAAGNGFGMLGLSYLLERDALAASPSRPPANPLAARPGHRPAKAKSCIFLFMTGGPSQMDLFDPKPALDRLDGQPLPPGFGHIHSQFLENDPLCLGTHRKFGKYGESGMDMSDLVPHMHQHADTIALVRSCVVDSVVHAPAMYQFNSGRIFMGFPSLGSWVTYGLGSVSDDLPAYVVMTQPEGTPEGSALLGERVSLPASYQVRTLFRNRPRADRQPETRRVPSSRRSTASAGRSTCCEG